MKKIEMLNQISDLETKIYDLQEELREEKKARLWATNLMLGATEGCAISGTFHAAEISTEWDTVNLELTLTGVEFAGHLPVMTGEKLAIIRFPK